MKNWTERIGSLSAAAFLAVSLHGQDENASDGIEVLTPFNIIGNKADVSSLQGTGTVLDASDLGPFFHTDITEILRQVPGVYVRPEEGYGLFPNISLRGVDPNRSSKVTIMEDGIPSSPSPFSDPSAYYSPTAGRMSGFEILKGSSSLKYGPNNTGGVINYLSTPIPNQQLSHLQASYGENNERIGHAYSGGKTALGGGTLGYLVEVFDQRSDGWKTVNGLGNVPSSNAPVAKTDVTFKLGYEFGDENYLEFKAGRTDLDGDVSYIGLSKADFAANPYQRYHNTRLDNMDSDQTRYYLRFLKEFSPEVKLSTTAFYNEFNRDWYKVGKVRINDRRNTSGAAVVSTYESEKYDDDGDPNTDEIANPDYSSLEKWKSIGKGAFGSADHVNMLRGSGLMSDAAIYDGAGQVKYKHNDRAYVNKGIQSNLDFELGINSFDFGFRYTDDEYTYKDYTEDTYDITANGGGLVYNSTAASSKDKPSKNEFKKDRISNAWEWYLVDTIDFGVLTLTPGLRYTEVEYEYNNKKDSVSDVLLGLGVTYDFETVTLFGGLHQGHALPGYHGAEGALEEEQSLGLELGVRGTASRFGYELAYFNTSIDDMIAIPNAGSGLGDDAINIGEASTQGLEAVLVADLSPAGGIGVPVQFSITFTDAEFDSATTADDESRYEGGKAGNSIPFVADVQYNLRGGLVFDKLSTYLNYHWQDDVYVNASNTAPDNFDAQIKSYGVLDWSAFYQISKGVSLFGKVTNLADKEYAVSDLPDGLRPGAPRIASVGMSFDF
jgi:Fe(3+) dicitrate transport protein